MLDVTGISVAYGAHRALENATVRVEPGELVVILGANGAGKSSLLKAIAGTCEGSVQGNVALDGKSLSGLPADEIVICSIAFVPEGRGIFGDLTVRENLMLGAHAKTARQHQDKNLARVYELFPKLRERASQVARTMSGGEQQMVAIGRAIMANPKYLMLDEPSLGLSPLLCKELFENLAHIRDTGIGVLMVEQNAKQSLAISDRAYLLENGTITGENSARAMMNDPAVQAAYLGGAQGAATVTPIQSAEAGAISKASATSTPQKFVIGAQTTRTLQSSGEIAGVDIGSLVARAADLAGTGSGQTKPPISGAPKRPSPSSNGISAIDPSRTDLSPDDTEVQQLLEQLEIAATKARANPDTASGIGASDQRSPKHKKISGEEALLPPIPVYRKSKLEIYRRTPGGELVKVEER